MSDLDSNLDYEELPRLIEQASSPLERAILDAGRNVPSSDSRRLQVMLALGVGSSVALGTKTSMALAAGWKKVILSGAIVASGTAGVVAYQELSAPPPPERAPAVQEVQEVAPRAPLAAAPVVEESPTLVEEPAEVEESAPQQPQPAAAEAEPTARKRVHRRVAKTEVVAPKSVTGSDLQDEVAALDRARASLRAGNAQRALGHLGDYSKRFPKGSLRLEAEALRIQALAASGNEAEASRRAKRILERSPNSVLASRLRRYVID